MNQTSTEKRLIREGYTFHGAWISGYASTEEKKKFKERRKELKKQGLDVRTTPFQDGTALFVRRAE